MSRSSWEDRNKAITKSELAREYGISMTTLGKWLNQKIYEKLKEVGYNKQDALITPKQRELIYEHFGKP